MITAQEAREQTNIDQAVKNKLDTIETNIKNAIDFGYNDIIVPCDINSPVTTQVLSILRANGFQTDFVSDSRLKVQW